MTLRRRVGHIAHEFVEFVPQQLAPDTLYVSIEYATAVHSCLCGCGNRVVTPLTPTDWQLIYDGETVSLTRSVGNWSFPCQSHYWIERDRAHWHGAWSKEKIEANRAKDREIKNRYYLGQPIGPPRSLSILDANGAAEEGDDQSETRPGLPDAAASDRGFWRRLLRHLRPT